MKYDITLRVETDDIDATQAVLYQALEYAYPFTVEALVRIHEDTPNAASEDHKRLYGE